MKIENKYNIGDMIKYRYTYKDGEYTVIVPLTGIIKNLVVDYNGIAYSLTCPSHVPVVVDSQESTHILQAVYESEIICKLVEEK